MFGKLVKYDLKSMLRTFSPLWLVLLALSVLNHFTVDLRRSRLLVTLAMLAYVAVIAAVMVVTVVLVIQRFYNGLLKDEGYLMFTLPVRAWQLVLSKLVTALIVTAISMAAALLSVFVIAGDLETLRQLFRALPRALGQITGEQYLMLALVVVLMIAAILSAITHIYASLAIGHLFNSHRVGWAVAAYLITDVIITLFLALCLEASDLPFFDQLWRQAQLSEVGAINAVLGLMIAWCLVITAVCYVATERILANRLNNQKITTPPNRPVRRLSPLYTPPPPVVS